MITVAGSLAQSASCGGATSGDGSTSGDASNVTGGSGGAGAVEAGVTAGSGGAGAVEGGVTGGSGGTGEIPACPETYDFQCEPACTQTMECASGTLTVTVLCDSVEGTRLADESCAHEGDHCHAATQYHYASCYSGRWLLEGAGGNPPAPCPIQPPVAGTVCRPGGFGGDREACGYPCGADPENDAWTVIGCRADSEPLDGSMTYSWQSDGACGRDAGGDASDGGNDPSDGAAG